MISTALAVFAVAALHGACHPSTPSAGAHAGRAVPALAAVALTYETSDSRGGDATEGIHQEQLEHAEALRARLAAIDDAAPTDPARSDALAVERAELRDLLDEIEEAARDASQADWIELRDRAARAVAGERGDRAASRVAALRASSKRAK